MDKTEKEVCSEKLKALVGSGRIPQELADILIIGLDLEEPKFNKENRSLKNWKDGEE